MSYKQKVLDHFENPQNVGALDENDPNVGTGLSGAPACGDVMKLQIRVSDDGIIQDVKFKAFGCGAAIASASYATTMLLEGDNTIEQAEEIKNTDISRELSLPPVKLHCSMLAEDAIRAAIANYKSKQEHASAT